MIDRQKTKVARSDERGAALIVAIAIMTILLAVALTFYAISRAETQNAINVRNQTQNDLNVDGVLAMVESELNRNFLKYPGATSYDQAPFTIYDGRWTVGKSWALRNDPLYGRVPLQGIDLPTDTDLLPDVPGVPLIDLRAMTEVRLPNSDGTFTTELLFSGPRTRDWLTIPRYEGANPYMYDPNAVDTGTGLAAFPFDLADRTRPLFVTPAFYGPSETRNELAGLDTRLEGEVERYPLEWIDTWTDVDNDLDGLKDAVWIPLPQDRFFSGGEVVDDATGRRMFADGIDNDLDGLIDENQEDIGNDFDGDGVPSELDPDEQDRQIELGSFVYYGGDDGLDNDGDGLIDAADVDETFVPPYYGLFLAASLPNLIIPIDLNADGKVPDFVPDNANNFKMTMLRVTLPPTILVNVRSVRTDPTSPIIFPPVALDDSRVDALDNDYDMLIDDFHVYAYVGRNNNIVSPTNPPFPPFQLRGFEDTGEVYPPNAPPALIGQPVIRGIENVSATNANEDLFVTARLKSYDWINSAAFGGALTVFPIESTFYTDVPSSGNFQYATIIPFLRITHSGEPVCDLVGRAAVTIRDEASKVNVNVAGGHNYDPVSSTVNIGRSLGRGATTGEIETRNLPDIDGILAQSISFLRTGTPKGVATPGFELDTQLPGYGRVDDNANALLYALNGKDDDGDGLIDEGLYLPDPSDANFPLYYDQLGLFEGVDEPGELQRYNPLPNLVAEGNNPFKVSAGLPDGLDNDLDGAFNERGELGDLQLQDTLQLTAVNGIAGGTSDPLQPLVTTFSTDRNVNFVSGREGIRAVNKLDYNFATPVQIAGNLLLANPFESVTARTAQFPNDVTRAYAEGLRQGDVHIRSTIDPNPLSPRKGILDATVEYFAADPVLQAMQAAVDIVDNRDRDHIRSVLTTEKTRITPAPLGFYDYFPQSLNMRERIADADLLPLGELQDHLRDQMAITRKLEVRDDWWTFAAGGVGVGVKGTTGQPEVREISYTTSGNEAIKINEIMVRAVRRVEAEAVPDDGLLLIAPSSDPMRLVATPNFFDPTPEGDKLPSPVGPAQTTVLPDFTVVRQTLPTSNWGQLGNPFIGEGSYLQTSGADINPDPVNGFAPVEDVLQFSIFPTNPFEAQAPPNTANVRPRPVGLPSGRYYLTVKATINGLPIQGDQLQYSIRYIDYSVPTPTILDDVFAASGAGLPAALNYFQERWISVPAAQVANGIGAPFGWVFINGTPASSGSFLGAGNNYFLDGGFDHGTPAVGNSATFTVSVPEYTATDLDGDGIRETLVDTNGDGLPDKALCIAFRLNSTLADTALLQIDALDFSQEPDHEWVELVNTSNEAVNIGGWNLEVGVPDRPSVTRDAFKSRWQVPPNTTVAPGGMVLLSFNKYDHYQALNGTSFQNPVADRVADNGIGLAAGDFLPHTEFLTNTLVTVPGIQDLSAIPALTTSGLFDLSGSVFRRFVNSNGTFLDYVDRDGDGRSSVQASVAIDDRTDRVAVEGNIRSTREQGSDLTAAIPNLPWDRIVQLDCLQYASADPTQVVSETISFDTIQTVDHVARMVLMGGVFPNYPEQDGYDNDGDGGYVVIGDIDGDTITEPIYVAGILDRDMVDNDLNGYVDERGTSLSGDGTDQPDFFGALDGSLGDGVNQFLSEGVDEGWGVGAGEYLAGTIGVGFFNTRQLGNYPTDDPFNLPFNGFNYFEFNLLSPPSYLQFTPEGATGLSVGAAGLLATSVAQPYMGSIADPPEWKAFVERRWYPGDNVIVTLYTTEISEETVVDRVTYREQDVTNRTIDDVVSWPYATAVGAVPWNAEYPTIWPPNHMGLDFYRSLERKHPFYNGDRFGTTNRWEATDGNYDDWADSLSFFEAELSSDPGNPLLNIAGQAVDLRRRFPATFPPTVTEARNLRLFGHAILGTPLRMNTAARKSENPEDVESLTSVAPPADTRQFPNPLDYFRTHEDGAYAAGDVPRNGIRTPADLPLPASRNTKSLANQSWNHSRAVVANRPYQSPGDLMAVTHQVYLHDAVNTIGAGAFLRDMTLLNYGLQGDTLDTDGTSYIQDIALRGATLGQDTVDGQYSPNILTAAIGSMALESVVLTVGQAEFRPILPVLPVGDATLASWTPNPSSSGPDDLLAPAAWAPVFLFDLSTDGARSNLDHFPNYPSYVNGYNANVEIPLHYLFNGIYLDTPGNFGGVNAYNNVLTATDRWPLETRTAMYVSEYPGTGDRPEALYTWDAADGLENGEYVLYIGTFLPDMRQRIENAAEASAGMPSLGVPAKSFYELLSTSAPSTTMQLEDGTILPVSAVTKSVLVRDPTNPRRVNRDFEPIYAIDVITDPSEARGQAAPSGGVQKPAGLIDPIDWQPTTQYKPGPDGYIFYGNNAAGGWKPQMVRVTDNFLAIRVRNMGEPGQVGALTHIVLAPRKRTSGRVNVNTAQSRVVETQPGPQNYYSTLLGLPGVVDVAQTIQPSNPTAGFLAPPISPADLVNLRSAPVPAPNMLTGHSTWTPPERRPLSTIVTAFYDDASRRTPPSRNRFSGDLFNPDNDLLVVDGPYPNEEKHEIGAFRLNSMLMGGRTEHADGRYFTSLGALAADTSAFDYNYIVSRADVPNINGAYTEGVEDGAIYPLSNEANPAKRFDEVQARFRRLGNLVTTRSDVFEIIMTVEAGYGVDANNDGFFNYRDPREFVTTAATKATAVYERRAPSDTSDGAE